MHPSTNVTYPLPRAQAPDDSGHRRECSWQSCSHSWRHTRQWPPSRHTARHRASSHNPQLQHNITVTSHAASHSPVTAQPSHASSPREFTQLSSTGTIQQVTAQPSHILGHSTDSLRYLATKQHPMNVTSFSCLQSTTATHFYFSDQSQSCSFLTEALCTCTISVSCTRRYASNVRVKVITRGTELARLATVGLHPVL